MSKVYLFREFDRLNANAALLLAKAFDPKKELLVKMHFGEPGNKAALTPADIAPIVGALKRLELRPTLFDTPVAYNSPRSTVEGYRKVVKQRGYNDLAPSLISDDYVEMKAKDFVVQVAKPLAEASQVLVISHVKGHYCSGFGGAIKNLAMGGVTKKTKSVEHALGKPKWVDECDGCGLCAKHCPAKAIKMMKSSPAGEAGKAVINLDKCWGCSICEVNCPSLAPQVALFDDVLGQAAAAVIQKMPKETYYINIIKNVAKFCDCDADGGTIVAKDVGILFSDDPVAIDRASVDLINKAEGRDVFKEENFKDPKLQIDFTAKYLQVAGKGKYEIID